MRNRSTEESIILSISGAISVGLLPFALIRILQGDVAIATLNSSAVVVTSGLFLHVYFTNNTHIARWGLSLLSVAVMTTTIHLKGSQQLLWVYPALTTVFFLLTPHIAAILSSFFLVSVLAMVWSQISTLDALRFTVSAGATLLFCYAFAFRMRNQQSFLKQMVTTDPLTKVGNRRALEEKLLLTIERLNRYPVISGTIVVLDIDFFKRINDRYGHGCGDKVLQQFTSIIEQRIRAGDKLYRYGGEEFVVVLDNTKLKDAAELADSIRHAVAEASWPAPNLKVTVSAGLAEYIAKESLHEWLDRADMAMYNAKEQGRNQCKVA